MSPRPAAALDADLVAFGLMLSGMLAAAAFVMFAVLCITSGGPFGATAVFARWMWRGLRWDPFPVTTFTYWLTTTASFPAWPAMRILITAVWGVVVACGIVGMGITAVKGPKEVRYFRGADGAVVREESRMKPKRVMPPKMDKAVKAMLPVRDRVAHALDVRWAARNKERASVGLEPLKQSWAHRQLVEKLPTRKLKDPKLKGKERTAARRDAQAEVALTKGPRTPKPATVPAHWSRREDRGYL